MLKRIYNNHLAESRKARKKPFRLRKDFTNLKPSVIRTLERLESFFNKHKQIDICDFFKAPYEIYPNDEYFDLDFFISYKAISTYNLYKKSKSELNTDVDEKN